MGWVNLLCHYIAVRTAGGGHLLEHAFGMETSPSFNASRMFQHFAKPLADAVAATADLDDGGVGSRGNRSHATRQALEALAALAKAFRGKHSPLAARLLGGVPHQLFERLEIVLKQLAGNHEEGPPRSSSGTSLPHEQISDILSQMCSHISSVELFE
jgi:hypothetical protein